MPKALGLLHEAGMAAGRGAAGAWATTTGASAARAGLLMPALSIGRAGARPSVGAVWVGADNRSGLLCTKIAPNTATHSTIASADAIAARRMSDLQSGALKPHAPRNGPKSRPMSLIQP